MIHSANSFVVDETLAEDELLCELCCDLIDLECILSNSVLTEGSPNGTNANTSYQLTCGHNFCSKCWKNYLDAKVIPKKRTRVF